MTDEEIGRFASVLKECERIRAMMARDEVALSNGEHDGIPIAAAPPEEQPPMPTRAPPPDPPRPGGLPAHSTMAIHPTA